MCFIFFHLVVQLIIICFPPHSLCNEPMGKIIVIILSSQEMPSLLPTSGVCLIESPPPTQFQLQLDSETQGIRELVFSLSPLSCAFFPLCCFIFSFSFGLFFPLLLFFQPFLFPISLISSSSVPFFSFLCSALLLNCSQLRYMVQAANEKDKCEQTEVTSMAIKPFTIVVR